METIKENSLVYFIGIGGCGMSAIAKIMHNKGYLVMGSDKKESVNTIRLRDIGIKVNINHDIENIRGADIVIVSTAIREDNPELIFAIENDIPIYKRAEALAWLMNQYEVRIAVSGTHGKTTTTAMLASAFEHYKLNPAFLVGGDMRSFNDNARHGDARYFITEADESDASILFLKPNILIITNIEADHLEHLGSIENIENIFWQVVDNMPLESILIINKDNEYCQKLILKAQTKKGLTIISYGTKNNADYYFSDTVFKAYTSKADIYHKEDLLGEILLNIPGKHNIENSLAVIAISRFLGISFKQIQEALVNFSGTKRRFQLIGKHNEITIIDDYAHHPSEIKATLCAAKNGFKNNGHECKIICVFQPHRYSRTMFLAHDFAKAFDDADFAIITNVYSAGEDAIKGISGRTIFCRMKDKKKAFYISKKEDVSNMAIDMLSPGDIFITMGAGDIHTVAKEILLRLKSKDNNLIGEILQDELN